MSKIKTTLVLAGSGEFTPAMIETDRYLLSLIPKGKPVVAIVPTASGPEKAFQSWIDKGMSHFANLGAIPIAIPARNRSDCDMESHAKLAETADFIYFSGGNPQHLYESLKDTILWKAILARYRGGSILAGSSAGAMVLGKFMPAGLGPQILIQPVTWKPAFGLAKYSILPHYDHTPSFVKKWFDKLVDKAPDEVKTTLLGIDEDTALIIRGGEETVMGASGIHHITSI